MPRFFYTKTTVLQRRPQRTWLGVQQPAPTTAFVFHRTPPVFETEPFDTPPPRRPWLSAQAVDNTVVFRRRIYFEDPPPLEIRPPFQPWISGQEQDHTFPFVRKIGFDEPPPFDVPKHFAAWLSSQAGAPAIDSTLVFSSRKRDFPEPYEPPVLRLPFAPWVSSQAPPPSVDTTFVFVHRDLSYPPDYEAPTAQAPKAWLWDTDASSAATPSGATMGFRRLPQIPHDPFHDQARWNAMRLADPTIWISFQGVHVNPQGQLDLKLGPTTANLLQTGTQGLDFAAVAPNTVLAGPAVGGMGPPTARALVPRDLGIAGFVADHLHGLPVTLFVQTGAVGNALNASVESNLMGYLLDAGALQAAADVLMIEALATVPAGGNFKVYLGTAVLFSGSAGAGNDLLARVYVFRDGTYFVEAVNASGNAVQRGTATIDPNGSQRVQCTGADAIVNTVIQRLLRVVLFPA